VSASSLHGDISDLLASSFLLSGPHSRFSVFLFVGCGGGGGSLLSEEKVLESSKSCFDLRMSSSQSKTFSALLSHAVPCTDTVTSHL